MFTNLDYYRHCCLDISLYVLVFSLFHLDVIEFKNIFLKNGYPSNIIGTCIKKFLDKISCKKLNRCTVPKKEFFIVLPYLGTLSSKIQKQIRNVFQKTMPWSKIKLTFKTHTWVSHFFCFKDPLPNALVSNITYSYSCTSYMRAYIGETDRHSKVRWGEHLGISCFTGQSVKGLSTAIKDHLKLNKCESDVKDVSVIGCESNRSLRELKESLFINQLKPNLNKQVKSAKLFLF